MVFNPLRAALFLVIIELALDVRVQGLVLRVPRQDSDTTSAQPAHMMQPWRPMPSSSDLSRRAVSSENTPTPSMHMMQPWRPMESRPPTSSGVARRDASSESTPTPMHMMRPWRPIGSSAPTTTAGGQLKASPSGGTMTDPSPPASASSTSSATMDTERKRSSDETTPSRCRPRSMKRRNTQGILQQPKWITTTQTDSAGFAGYTPFMSLSQPASEAVPVDSAEEPFTPPIGNKESEAAQTKQRLSLEDAIGVTAIIVLLVGFLAALAWTCRVKLHLRGCEEDPAMTTQPSLSDIGPKGGYMEKDDGESLEKWRKGKSSRIQAMMAKHGRQQTSV